MPLARSADTQQQRGAGAAAAAQGAPRTVEVQTAQAKIDDHATPAAVLGVFRWLKNIFSF
jgi:hypothetical protein